MKRRTQEPWFAKKRDSWGIRPYAWQGWLVSLIFALFMVGLMVIMYLNTDDILQVELLTIIVILAFLITISLTSDDSIHKHAKKN